MPRKIAKSFTVQPPDLAQFKGKTLRAFLEELIRWLRLFARQNAEPGSLQDRFIAVTSGTITANAGVDGPMGGGNVVYRKIEDDDTLTAKDTIAVKSIVLTTIATGRLVIVERIEGKYVITSMVCP